MTVDVEGYSFDKTTQQHVFSYREYIPENWAIEEYISPRRAPFFTVVLGVITFFLGLGLTESLSAAATIGAIGAACGWFLGNWTERVWPATKAELTGKRQPKLRNSIVDFLIEWRVDAAGQVTLYREYAKAQTWKYPRKIGESGITRFRIDDVASIERVRLIDKVPGFARNGTSTTRLTDPRKVASALVV